MYEHQYALWNHRTEVKCDKTNSARLKIHVLNFQQLIKRADIWFSGMKVVLKLSLFCTKNCSNK